MDERLNTYSVSPLRPGFGAKSVDPYAPASFACALSHSRAAARPSRRAKARSAALERTPSPATGFVGSLVGCVECSRDMRRASGPQEELAGNQAAHVQINVSQCGSADATGLHIAPVVGVATPD